MQKEQLNKINLNLKKISFLLIFVFTLNSIFAQQKNLPNGFRKIQLGMTMEEVKSELLKDTQFGYRGDRDVSLLPTENRSLIETDTSKTAPYSFLERCWFQFYDGKLYTITLNLKTEKLDHYSVFAVLCEKYGNPSLLNPEKSEWKNDSVIMTLERPLTVKYVDKKVFEELLNQSLVNKSAEEMTREMFLDEF